VTARPGAADAGAEGALRGGGTWRRRRPLAPPSRLAHFDWMCCGCRLPPTALHWHGSPIDIFAAAGGGAALSSLHPALMSTAGPQEARRRRGMGLQVISSAERPCSGYFPVAAT